MAAMIDCYNRYAAITNGMFARFAGDFRCQVCRFPRCARSSTAKRARYEYRRGVATSPLSKRFLLSMS